MVLGLVILVVRRHVPESPRWLLIHGREREAEDIVSSIERRVEAEKGEPLPEPEGEISIQQRKNVGFGEIARTIFATYRKRSVLGFSLFIGQAFLYNAITFGFGAILTTFFDVPTGNTGYYFAVIAVGNFFGPLLLGKLFDTVGRRVMISSTYLLSGLLLFGTAWLFDRGSLTATTLTACWCAVLFFASAGASSAYLTVSEIFPMETRAMSIAFFYAIGTAAGGITGPLVFADLTESGVVGDTVLAFQIGAGLMCAAGIVAAFLAVNAERRSLEDIAKPLTAVASASAKAKARVTRKSAGRSPGTAEPRERPELRMPPGRRARPADGPSRAARSERFVAAPHVGWSRSRGRLRRVLPCAWPVTCEVIRPRPTVRVRGPTVPRAVPRRGGAARGGRRRSR